MCVLVCVIATWRWGVSGRVPVCESVLEHPESSERERELITANCLDEAQQLELPSCHSKTPNTHTYNPCHIPITPWTEVSSLFAPHASFLWLPNSWQDQIYSSENFATTTRWLRGCWSQYEPTHTQTAEVAFFSCGVPPSPCCGINGILKMLADRCLTDRKK